MRTYWKKCYFSELRDFSQELDYSTQCKFHASAWSYEEDESAQVFSNSTFNVQCDNSLTILSKGGMRFSLPLDQPISNVFALADGLLLEFSIKQEPKLQGFRDFPLKFPNNFSAF